MPRDSKPRESSRRQFLKATGATGVTVAVAGCGGDDGEEATGTPGGGTPGGGGGATQAVDLDKYPYGIGETRVSEAKRVMEEAGYGPDNQYELSWLQYTSPTWKEMANTIRARLSSAHINMSISEASFSELLNTTKKGNHEAYTLGWVADYPGVKNFAQLIDPQNTIYDNPDITPNGARLFWSDDANVDSAITAFQSRQFDRIQNNSAATEQARSIRQDAGLKMEEGNWAAAGLVPVYHPFDEFFWYDRVDYNPPGGMNASRAKSSQSVRGLSGSQTLQGTSATFNSLDPIASGNTASGTKIMDLYDAPMNYVNGTTEVADLLVEDYTTNDDNTRYEFTLKQGVQFHGDYGEVTADDMVYSIQRLVESPHSTNTYFPITVLGIEHETEEETFTNDEGETQTRSVVVPGSTAVEKTGEYSFAIELSQPFAYTLPVLAYSAFSVVPEGIVGDVEGYDGEMSWEEFSSGAAAGTGPFVFENWESGDGGEFTATAFEDYHGQAANFDGLHDAIIVSPNAQFNYFLNQNSDVDGIPTSKYSPDKVTVEEELEGGRVQGTYGPMANGQTVNYAGVPNIGTYYIGFNMERVPQAVREAMAYVVNQDQFIQSVFKSRGKAAYHVQPMQIIQGGREGYNQHYQGS